MLIVGRDTGIGADLQAQATRLGISHNLVWLGEQSEPTPILQAADIGLQCSLQEGFSNALLESMAAGLPIIATTAGGNIDAVIDGDSGLLVPIEDSRALADAITRLAQAADLRTAMGGAARQRVAEVFSPELCVEKYLDLYRRVLI
jgi:glycosyltransferase involved in cell wall biosynthesis